jgi:small subunit ribosomal protein S21
MKGPFEGESMTTDGVEEEVAPEAAAEVEAAKEVEAAAEVEPAAKVEAAAEVEPAAKAEPAAETKATAPVAVEKERYGSWDKRPKYNGDRDDSDYDKSKRRKRGAGDAVVCRPLEVVVRDDRVEQAIRQLKNRMAREGVLRELKNRRHYFKPSELKRIKSREAARRRRKTARQKNGQ